MKNSELQKCVEIANLEVRHHFVVLLDSIVNKRKYIVGPEMASPSERVKKKENILKIRWAMSLCDRSNTFEI